MSRAVVIILLSFSSVLFGQSMQTFQELIGQVENRSDLDIGDISNPFETQSPKEQNIINQSILKKKSESYELLAIFANRAKVNGKWVKVGEMIDGQKVLKIGKKSIVLDGKNKQELYLKGVKGVSIQVD